MAAQELDSFYFKFKNLLLSEKDATLTVKSEAGRLPVSLSVDLGHVLSERGPPHHHHRRNGPSQQRRRERRAEKRAKETVDAEEAPVDLNVDKTAEQAKNLQIGNDDKTTEKVDHKALNENDDDNSEEEIAKTEFLCELCDFKSNWSNGLNIHMSRKHSKLEQLDGTVDESSEDETYRRMKHYLKKGWLGSAYQTFIDANDVIEGSDLNEEAKAEEKIKVLEARKLAIGPYFMGFPPWSSS